MAVKDNARSDLQKVTKKFGGKEPEQSNEPLLPPGLREDPLTLEEAEKIRQILDDPVHPVHGGVDMPVIDPPNLRRKK